MWINISKVATHYALFHSFAKMRKCMMMEIVIVISAAVAAISVDGIVLTLFLIAIGKIAD